MRKYAFILVGAIACSGCAAPLPLTIASLMADGVSYATTEKSLTDHGLSALSNQDCAVYRLLTEGAMCRDQLEEIQVVENTSSLAHITPKPKPAIPATTAVAKKNAKLEGANLGTIGEPLPGVYMVIGSSRNLLMARSLGQHYRTQSTQVFAMPVGGRRVTYHVIVGPITQTGYLQAQKDAALDGFKNTWALKINVFDWQRDKQIKQQAKAKMTASINL